MAHRSSVPATFEVSAGAALPARVKRNIHLALLLALSNLRVRRSTRLRHQAFVLVLELGAAHDDVSVVRSETHADRLPWPVRASCLLSGDEASRLSCA